TSASTSSLQHDSFLVYEHSAPRDLHSFPTRRSSDLTESAYSGRSSRQREASRSRGSTKRRSSPGASAAPTPRTKRAISWTLSARSEEHTSELQSLTNLVCRLLLEKKKTQA